MKQTSGCESALAIKCIVRFIIVAAVRLKSRARQNYSLTVLRPPDAVQNCSVQNQTEDSVALACSEGYDGGLQQLFRLELHDTSRRLLRANVSSAEAPVFVARGLPPGTSFVAAVYAFNSRGRSQPTVLVVSTLPAPVSLTRKGSPGGVLCVNLPLLGGGVLRRYEPDWDIARFSSE
ncbi:hypothetical protein HPB49_024225 [Dermacentor silvarum]|uniref:Uncharacterized protein n=1 Tax=Dermacentor silvarum TaxID=543639 RepID=A0ACB8CNG4_DERSI|nr:hypothetical protein HPB49_024225 [Dermacentor silvarum]